MSITLNGSGSISGLAAGGLPDGTITTPDLADNTITNAKLAFDGGAFGFRNKIINGDMRIDQRNVGASVNITTIGHYITDRFVCLGTQDNKYAAQRSPWGLLAPAGFNSFLGVISLSSYALLSTDYFNIRQRIEGYNSAYFGFGTAGAKTITLSFWVYSSLTGQFGGCVKNSAGNRFYAFPYTINSAGTWEYKTITIPGDTTGSWPKDNSTGLEVVFSLGAGSGYVGSGSTWTSTPVLAPTGSVSLVETNNALFAITGVQLEAGSVATPFEARPYGLELALCQRYYEAGVAPFFYIASTGTTLYGEIAFKVVKRVSPTFVPYNWKYFSGLSPTVVSGLSISSSDIYRIVWGFVGATNASGMDGTGTWTASAEL